MHQSLSRLVCTLGAMYLMTAGTISVAASGQENLPQARGGSILWVGDDDNDCDHDSLHDALSAASDGDQVRMTTEQVFFDHPYEIKKSLTLVGGFAACGDSLPEPFSRTRLGGSLPAGERVLLIDEDSGELDINLWGLEITGGNITESTSDHGAGLKVSGPHEVVLERSEVTGNFAGGNGGGIYVGDGADLLIENAVIIDLNFSLNGGGVACESASLRIGSDVEIAENQANDDDSPDTKHGNGGGIWTSACDLKVHAGGPDNQGIHNNDADKLGGALYDDGGSQILIDGAESNLTDPEYAVHISGNEGNWHRGGLSIGPTSNAELVNTIIEANTGGQEAAIALDSNASLKMRGVPDSPCRKSIGQGPTTCSKIIDNHSTSASVGSIVSVREDASLEMQRTEIAGNQVRSRSLVVANPGTEVLIGNSLIAGNIFETPSSEDAVILVQNTTNVAIGWSTIADHDENLNQIFRFVADSDATAGMFMEGLVLDQDSDVIGAAGDGDHVVTRAACILAPETDTIETHAEGNADLIGELIADKAGFIDPDTGNYRLTSHSPAIDVCGALTTPPYLIPPDQDIDGGTRGIAYHEETGSNVYDLGAFERGGGILFRDRFEE